MPLLYLQSVVLAIWRFGKEIMRFLFLSFLFFQR